MNRPRFWRTLPAFVILVGLIGAVAGFDGASWSTDIEMGSAGGALVGVLLAVLTELFRWDCSETESFWFPRRPRVPPLDYQEKFRPAFLAADAYQARSRPLAVIEDITVRPSE